MAMTFVVVFDIIIAREFLVNVRHVCKSSVITVQPIIIVYCMP